MDIPFLSYLPTEVGVSLKQLSSPAERCQCDVYSSGHSVNPNRVPSDPTNQVQLLNDAYNLVIDAILGPETNNTEVKEPYAGMLVTLKQVKIPIVSVDMPSGICSLSTFREILPMASLLCSATTKTEWLLARKRKT